MLRVKICGITSLYDAVCSIENGASVLGFNFYPKSPRYIKPEEAMRIIVAMPPFVLSAGVFVNESMEYIKMVQRLCCLDIVQLHGDETPEYCRKFDSVKLIKAIRVKHKEDLQAILRYNDVAGILVDAFHTEQYGGTGLHFQWDLLKLINSDLMDKIIVAGGITPDNITKLLEDYNPSMIDVCSGVEHKKGIKDHAKIRKLFLHVLNYNKEIR